MAIALATLLSPVAQAAEPVFLGSEIGSLRFIGEQDVPNDLTVDETLVGGLSGIDYDPATGNWLAISDDRSQNGAARFYTLTLDYDADGFNSVNVESQTTLLQADGLPYPNADAGGDVPDPESIRIDPVDGGIWWTSECDQELGTQPLVRAVDGTGAQIADFTVPEIFATHPESDELGCRSNNSFEGLTFSPDGSSIWVLSESAIYQDGPIATVDAGAVSRLIQFDRDGNVVAEYAYPVDPIPVKPGGDFADNGASEILAVDATHFLVLERSGVEAADGSFKDYIRIYEIDISNATNVAGTDALTGATYQPVEKRLVLDLSQTDLTHVDNIEGISWGPKLANGNSTLVLISDNNFNDTQITQLLAYEVLPPGTQATPIATPGATPISG
jgi:hypothetical protein